MNELVTGTVIVAVSLILAIALTRASGSHLPHQLGTGRCWHCGTPTPSKTGVCAHCEDAL